MPDAALAPIFFASAAVSLSASWVLVSRIERVGARLGFSEALLGMVTALAANAPEITAAITAVAGHQGAVGAGVALGSNVFNLAALLALAAVVAGRVAFHRRVIAMEGTVAIWVALLAVLVVVGGLPAGAGFGLALVVFLSYVAILAGRRAWLDRLGAPRSWLVWLAQATGEEEAELHGALEVRPGGRAEARVALAAVAVVIAASVAMEKSAATLAGRLGISQVVLGGLILAGVTSLPNAVAATYLAGRGRGAAVLSTATNSNALNVVAGLLLPATIVGLAASSGGTVLVAAWYLGLTVVALALAYAERGLRRASGTAVIGAYLLLVGLLASGAVQS
jgi:cation:H+ antiporter